MNTETLSRYSDKAIEMFMLYAPKLVLALAVLFFHCLVINRLMSGDGTDDVTAAR